MTRPARSRRIHTGLVGRRELVGTPYLADPELRRQYESEIAPRTRAALGRILDDLQARAEAVTADIGGGGAGAFATVERVLDLGAGTGAAGDLIRERLGAVEVVSVDRVATRPGVVVADLKHRGRPRGVEGRFDLIVAAHLLNELAGTLDLDARAALVFSWGHELLAEGGRMILIEPALQQTSRDLLQIRDRLLPAGFFVLAPCLVQGPCPALVRDRDWCHASAPWEPAEAAARAGHSRVDYSYVVLARTGQPCQERRLFRVVSDPIVEKGRLRLWGCGPAGRHPLVRLDRDRSPENAGFDQATRGDLMIAGPTERAGDGLRIGPTSRVQRR